MWNLMGNLAKIYLKDTGDLEARDFDELMAFLNYLDPKSEKYSFVLASEFDKFMREAINEIEQDPIKKGKINPTFKVGEAKQLELLQMLDEVYQNLHEDNDFLRSAGLEYNPWTPLYLKHVIDGFEDVRRVQAYQDFMRRGQWVNLIMN